MILYDTDDDAIVAHICLLWWGKHPLDDGFQVPQFSKAQHGSIAEATCCGWAQRQELCSAHAGDEFTRSKSLVEVKKNMFNKLTSEFSWVEYIYYMFECEIRKLLSTVWQWCCYCDTTGQSGDSNFVLCALVFLLATGREPKWQLNLFFSWMVSLIPCVCVCHANWKTQTEQGVGTCAEEAFKIAVQNGQRMYA